MSERKNERKTEVKTMARESIWVDIPVALGYLYPWNTPDDTQLEL